ncbi:redoxin domain-containing protein [Candidatus Woesearchaeota archaeon]|nr:redoxin domain-containing protein [Candidatus Woesearchaeota archaeon]
MVEVGQKAPSFALKDEQGNVVDSKSFTGKKILLAFFPFAFSPVCTDEMKCFHSDLEKFRDKGIAILGISVDSHWSNAAFRRSIGSSIPLFSDFSKETAGKFGILRPEGFSERAYFLIDEKGIIRFKHVMETPKQKLDDDALLLEVGAL